MKTVIGIDYSGHYESAVRLLGRLRFTPNLVELIHAEEPVVFYGPPMYVPLEGNDRQRDAALKLLDQATERACASGLQVTDQRYVVDYSPARTLTDESTARHEDLIAIGSREKGRFGAFFAGSVGRALAIGSKASVLIAKGDVAPTGSVTVVLATDHSEYADEAVRLFARMNPKGIGRLILLTAVPSLEDGTTNEEEQTRMAVLSSKMVDHLRSFSLPAEYRVIEGDPEDVINDTMLDVGADLLVLGAQGHGWFERMMLGSVSLQQAVATPHSTLILRPR